MWCELRRHGREEATTWIDPPRQVLKEGFGQGCDARDPAERFGYLAHHVVFKDLGGRVDSRQLKILFGIEMRIEPALAHANVPGQLTDRKSFQTMGCGQSGGRVQDRAAALKAIGA